MRPGLGFYNYRVFCLRLQQESIIVEVIKHFKIKIALLKKEATRAARKEKFNKMIVNSKFFRLI
jgi:hypothetical protein